MILRLLLAALLFASAAHASPWAEVGDRQFRADVEMLRGAGVIRGPINAWPLAWAQIDNGLDAWGLTPLPPHLRAARDRVRRHSELAQRRTVREVIAAAATDPQLVRDFGGGTRETGEVTASVSRDFGSLYVRAGVGYREDQRGKDVHAEPSYAALGLGNVALYAGYLEHWWGPGNEGALLFSNSARPFPKVGLRLLEPRRIDLPVLRALGPVTFDVFAGVLTEDRDFDNTGIIGIRVAIEPVRGLEIAVNRGLQLCGQGRPCSINTIGRALIGFGNQDNTGTVNEPGNQLAGFDLSFTRQFGLTTVKIYGEAVAEDEDNLLIEQFARQAGVQFAGPLGDKGVSYTAHFEFTDTLASTFFGGRKFAGSLYNNFIYVDGFTYKRRPLGYSLDNDTRAFTLAAAISDLKNRRWYGSIRALRLNVTELGPLSTGEFRNRISRNFETVEVATAGVEWPTQYGDLRLEGRVQNDGPDTPGTSKVTPAIEIGFKSRF